MPEEKTKAQSTEDEMLNDSTQSESESRTIRLDLSDDLLEVIDKLKNEYGVRSRARTIELLLRDLILNDGEE